MCIIICEPIVESVEKRVLFCPTCQTERDFLVECYEWYSPIQTCLECGDEWSDGERGERPFMRGWRVKNIEVAKARLKTVVADSSNMGGAL